MQTRHEQKSVNHRPTSGGFRFFRGPDADARSSTTGSSPSAPTVNPTPSVKLRTVRVFVMTLFGFGVLATAFLLVWLNELQVFTPPSDKLQTIVERQTLDNSIVLDRNGHRIGEFFSSDHRFIPFEELPKSFVNAVVAIEDRNFWDHPGFDPKGIARATFVHFSGHPYEQGASTITQQVVRNFVLPRERTIQRKIQEIAYAVHLEAMTSKERLFEVYANDLFLGNGAYGVGAAAYRYFGKRAQDLAAHESALIAGLFQSPSRYDPSQHPKRAKRRQIQVIKAMYENEMLTLEKAKQLIRNPLDYENYEPMNMKSAPYFLSHIRKRANELLSREIKTVENQGLTIHTTLDMKLQKAAERSINEAADDLERLHAGAVPAGDDGKTMRPARIEAALVSLDPRNGHILAMVGGRDHRTSKFNRVTQAHRSPGSAFKPIVYSQALKGGMKWNDMIYVAPVNIDDYRPRTPQTDYLTETTLLRAFYRSMNGPTIEVAQKVGMASILKQAEKIGIKSPLKKELGSALGSSDVTMMDMARVYSSFANRGRLVNPVAITRITDREGNVLYDAPDIEDRRKRVLSPAISYVMTQGMRAVLSRGTGYRAASLARHAAGKTGTSNGATDNWFCGYAPNLVTVNWVGTDAHVPIKGGASGGRTALPIWKSYMEKAFRHRSPESFERPEGVTSVRVHPRYGYRTSNGMRMYFLEDNKPARDKESVKSLSNIERGKKYRNVFFQ